MAGFVAISSWDIWPGDQIPAPLFIETRKGKARIWEAGDTVSNGQLDAWRRDDRDLFVREDRLSSFASFVDNQMMNVERGSGEWLSRYGVVLTTRLRLLKRSPELPGLLVALRRLSEIQSTLEHTMLGQLILQKTIRASEPSIWRQILTASLVTMIGRHARGIKDVSALVYAAYVMELGRLVQMPDESMRTSVHGQVVMSILAKHHPVSQETHAAIIGYQERLDGNGLPYGCSESAIPIPARCLGLASFLANCVGRSFEDWRELRVVIEQHHEILGACYDPVLLSSLKSSYL